MDENGKSPLNSVNFQNFVHFEGQGSERIKIEPRRSRFVTDEQLKLSEQRQRNIFENTQKERIYINIMTFATLKSSL